MPSQRKLWKIRQLYGGLPPTDPRFLALTKEQIDLDLMHNIVDAEERKNGGSEVYVDENYTEDELEDETDDIDTDELYAVLEDINVDDEAEWEDVDE